LAAANLSLPEGFDQVVRLFPLPNLVLFPGLVQALHIFEPRYRQLMADALDSDQLISLALLQSPAGAESAESIFSTICIGKIVSHAKTDDGRYNLILAGLCRARVIEEMPRKRLYRMAKIELPAEVEVDSSEDERELRNQVVKLCRQQLAGAGRLPNEEISKWLESEIPLGSLCDLVTFVSSANPMDHLRVLEEFDIRARAELLIELLANQPVNPPAVRGDQFPPNFSAN
jgi:Lon protease-like protein